MLASHLRLIIGGIESPARNMAVDEALLKLAGAPTLRVYSWDRPCLSIGYFSRSQSLWPGVDFVRRASGGGIVRHGDDLTFSAVFPRAHLFARANAADAYRIIHESVRAALKTFDIRCRLADGCLKNNTGLCFSGHEKYDLLDAVTSQKIAGGAQKRSVEGFLHQGSVLRESGGLPAKEDFAPELAEQFARRFELNVAASVLSADEERLAVALEKSRYTCDAWNKKY